MKPVVVISGILDTKGKELRYIRDCVRNMGCDTLVMELSLGKELHEDWVDICLSQLLMEIGKTPEDVFSLTRGEAAKLVTQAAVKKIESLHSSGKIHGIIAYCGGMGSSIAAPVMQALPYGMPKVLLSTMIHNAQQYVGSKDIAIMYPVTESGLNRISRAILNTAAGMAAGGAHAYASFASEADKPLIAVSMQGVTTPCAQRLIERINQSGVYDGMIIHGNGEGGRTLECMVRESCFLAVADVTLGELSATLLGGVNDAGADRMNAAVQMGIPQVLAPGSVDFSSFRDRNAISPKLLTEEQNGAPGRKTHYHNAYCTVCTITPEEARSQGVLFAKKLNGVTAPTSFLIPMRGWSAYDIAAPDLRLGWAGPDCGPSWLSDPQRPEWSLRARLFLDGFLSALEMENEWLEVYRVDMHINDSAFADLVYSVLSAILAGRFKRGSFEDGRQVERVF